MDLKRRFLACFVCFFLLFSFVFPVSAYTVDGGITPSYDGKLLNPGDYAGYSTLDLDGPFYSRYESNLGVTFSYILNTVAVAGSEIGGYTLYNSSGWAYSSIPGNFIANHTGSLLLFNSIGFHVEPGKEYHFYVPTLDTLAPDLAFTDYGSNDTDYIRVGFSDSNDPQLNNHIFGFDPTTVNGYIDSTYSVSTVEEVLIGNVTWNHVVFTCPYDMLYPVVYLHVADKPDNVYNFSVYLNTILLENCLFSDAPIVAEEDSTNGWLSKIKSVLDTVVTTLTSLPTLIWNVFSDGLKGLFIPTAEQIENLNSSLENTFGTKLGVVWTAFDTVLGILQAALGATSQDSIMFPGITLDLAGSQFVWNAQAVDIWPAGFEILENTVKSVVTMIILLAWFNGMIKIKDRIIGGGDDG